MSTRPDVLVEWTLQRTDIQGLVETLYRLPDASRSKAAQAKEVARDFAQVLWATDLDEGCVLPKRMWVNVRRAGDSEFFLFAFVPSIHPVEVERTDEGSGDAVDRTEV